MLCNLLIFLRPKSVRKLFLKPAGWPIVLTVGPTVVASACRNGTNPQESEFHHDVGPVDNLRRQFRQSKRFVWYGLHLVRNPGWEWAYGTPGIGLTVCGCSLGAGWAISIQSVAE